MSNTNYNKVSNTLLSNSALASSQFSKLIPLQTVKVYSGSVTPTGAGNYPVLNENGGVVTLRDSQIVLAASLLGPQLTSGGAMTTTVGPAATSGGAVAVSLLGAQSLGNVRTGVAAVYATGAMSTHVTGNQFMSMTTAVAAATSGTIYANFWVLDTAPAEF